MSLARKVNNAVREKRRQDKQRRRERRTSGERSNPDGTEIRTPLPSRRRRRAKRQGRKVKEAERRRQSSPPPPMTEDGKLIYPGRGIVGH